LGLVHALAFGTDLDGDTKPDLFVTSDEEVFAYSGDDGAPLGVFVAPGTGGLQRPLGLLFVPDLDADDVSDLLLGTNSFDGTGEGVVLALSGVDGSFIREFTPRVDNTVIRFNQMDLGPDGALYIIDTLGDQVLRYDAAADEFEAFVPSGSGGLGEATPFLAFDPEGDLYVSNENQREVLKYEGPLAGEPGAFIGVFAHGSRWIISEVRDINDSQQIVGWGYPQGALGDMTPGAFLLTPPAAGGLFGTITSLGGPAGSDVRPEAINNNGDVAGSYNVGGAHAAFLSTPEDEFVDLGQLNGTNTFAHDLSDRHAAGQVTIVGEWAAHEQAWRAVCTPGAIGGAVPLLQLGSLFSDRRTPGSSSVFGVNNAGQIVGFTTTGRNDTRAARYTASGGWVSLGTLAPSTASSWNDSEAQAINDAGYTVGQSMVGDVNAVPNIRAFIHADGIGIRDLASLVDDLSPADAGELGLPAAINNSRLICGPFVTNYTDVETKEAYVLLPYTVP
jgi:probable HAF family extracellular repeat protein